MPELDISRILHENPTKHLMLEHQKLVEDFTEEHAKEYSEAYKGQPLSFLLENSRYIFSEPYFGYAFYKEQVLDAKHALDCVYAYSEESDKIRSYLDEHGSDMGTNQKEMYESLIEELDQKHADTENLRNVLEFMESVYTEEECDPEKTSHPLVYFATAPFFIAEGAEDNIEISERLYDIRQLCLTENTDESDWKSVFESIVAIGKLHHDPVYMEVVEQYTSPDFKRLVHALAKESVEDQIKSISTVPIESVDTVYYGSAEGAVGRIFEMADNYDLYKESYDEKAETVDSLCGYAYDLLSSLATFEYISDPESINRLGCVDAGGNPKTVSDAFNYYTEMASKYMYEAKGNDNEDIGEPSPTVRASAGYSLEDKPEGKKSKPPVPKSAAKKVQFSFMDKEADAYRRMAKAKEKGEEIKGAAKAVGAIPLKVKDDIDESIKKWDAMDDERRRKYIVKPGFRKKAFRNLKLAMLYGASASYSLLMIPITMIARHYSKQKDRRIRNQLAHELTTEIDICKEKIQDAASNGDNKEKYKLMRIKSKLEQERKRVLANSRYI